MSSQTPPRRSTIWVKPRKSTVTRELIGIPVTAFTVSSDPCGPHAAWAHGVEPGGIPAPFLAARSAGAVGDRREDARGAGSVGDQDHRAAREFPEGVSHVPLWAERRS